MPGAQDLQFHWQRIQEWHNDIQAGHWLPEFATNEDNDNGAALMAFYPYLTLFPIVLLTFMCSNDLSIIMLSYIGITFATMLISYKSSVSISKSRRTSFLFAIIYGLSLTHLSYFFNVFDLGVFISLAFLPLAIFGFMQFIKNGSWHEMAAGLILIGFSHLLNFIFTCLFLLIWSMMNYKHLQKFQKLLNGIKAVSCTILSTTFFWLPAGALYLANDIRKPFEFQLGGTYLRALVKDAVTGQLNTFLTILDLIAVVLGLYYYPRLSKLTKQCLWLSIGICIICSRLVPWSLLQTPLSIIQFPWRLLIFPELLLDYLLADIIMKRIPSFTLKYLGIGSCILVTVGMSCIGQVREVQTYQKYSSLRPMTAFNLPKQPNGGHLTFKLTDNQSFNNLTPNTSNDDYYLEAIKPMEKYMYDEKGTYDKKHHVRFYLASDHSFRMSIPHHIKTLLVPYQDYKTGRYQVRMNHHLVPYQRNHDGVMEIHNVNPNDYLLSVKPITSKYVQIGTILSLIGLCSLLVMPVRSRIKKYFKKES